MHSSNDFLVYFPLFPQRCHMCSIRSFLSFLCVGRALIAEFLWSTSAKHGLGLSLVRTSGGRTMVALGFSFSKFLDTFSKKNIASSWTHSVRKITSSWTNSAKKTQRVPGHIQQEKNIASSTGWTWIFAPAGNIYSTSILTKKKS